MLTAAALTAERAFAALNARALPLAAELFDRAAAELTAAIDDAADVTRTAALRAKADEYRRCATDLHQQQQTKALLARSQVDELVARAQQAEAGGDAALAIDLASAAAAALLAHRKAAQPGSPPYQQLTAQIADLLDYAERLKTSARTVRVSAPTHAAQSATMHRSQLSTREQDVLRASSVVNGLLFLPWVDDDKTEKFNLLTQFDDPDGLLELSPKQRAHFFAWRRLSEIAENPVIIAALSSYSIVQDVISDCSFVSSLCIAAMFERKFKKPLISNQIYPQDRSGRPIYNASGKYLVKLHFNGIWRKVVIDDRLPVDRSNRLLVTHSTNASEFFPSLIEKAYLKLMGGYNFPGSTSGVDLHTLTGWLPEQGFMKDANFNADRQWARLLDGQNFGDALITVSTGELSAAEAERLGLVPTHAYAVLQVRDVEGKRLLLVKNPWSHTRWRGRFSPHDTASWTPALQQALSYNPAKERASDDGLFWIDYGSLQQAFKSVHINWNPELFVHRALVHSAWPDTVYQRRDAYNLGPNPQFWLEVDNTGASATAPVWLLLTRHITSTVVRDGNGVSKPKIADDDNFLAMHVFDKTQGRRVYYNENRLYEGTYTNSRHNLARLNLPPGVNRYTVVASQLEAKGGIQFTLRVYATAPVRFGEIPRIDQFERRVEGAWTAQTAGGSSNDPVSYSLNPVYWLQLSHGTNETVVPVNAVLGLAAPKDYAINLKVYSRIQPTSSASRFTHGDLIVTSGSYRHAFCYIELPRTMTPGNDYYVVVSTFEPGQVGGFILTFASERHPFSLTRV